MSARLGDCPVKHCWAHPGESCMFPRRFACARNQDRAAQRAGSERETPGTSAPRAGEKE